MADDDFFLSDTDDSAVEELISHAKELCALEAVSAINCYAFTDSVLPDELETRFRKLKSFPVNQPSRPNAVSKSDLSKSEPKDEDGNAFGDENLFTKKEKPDTNEGLDLEGKSSKLHSSSSGSSSSDWTRNAVFQKKKSQLRYGSFSSALNSSNSWLDSPSPPQKTGCFWCSPKQVWRKKSRESKPLKRDLDWGVNDDFLSDLNAFSFQEQKKVLKMAVKEQQKISKEAEKIVKLAKQASSRMSLKHLEDELSDD